MAMNGNTLGNKISDDILVAGGGDIGLSAGEATVIRNIWILIATDITDHIDTNAQILPGSFQGFGGTPITGQGDIE